MASLDKQLEFLLAKYEPTVAAEFRKAIEDIKSRTVKRHIVEALKRGDIEAAVNAMNIERAAFGRMIAALSAAYGDAGAIVVAETVFRSPELVRAVVRWDMANPRAEEWVRRMSSTRITRIVDETKDAVRRAILEGYRLGKGPNTIALDIIGRIGRTGRRQGGILGLTVPQQDYVERLIARLRSGDPGEMAKVLKMGRRDKRFDRTILTAMREGRSPPAAQVEKMAARYSDRLLSLRGEMVARTETAQAVEEARMEAFRQGLEKSGLPDSAVTRKWLHAGIDGPTSRVEHMQMDGVEVKGLDTPFQMPDGALMRYPLDPAGGADHVIGCRCTQTITLDYGAGLR